MQPEPLTGLSGIGPLPRKEQSIGTRLWILIVLNSCVALLIAAGWLYEYQQQEERTEAAIGLTTETSILSDSATAALSFEDAKAARDALSSLRQDRNVVEAALFDRDGAIVAHYTNHGQALSIPEQRHDGMHFIGDDILYTYQPIIYRGERIGTVYVRAETGIRDRLMRYLEILVVVLLVSLGIALYLSSGMRKAIARPIADLAAVAARITTERDYSVRAVSGGGSEIRVLIDSFNKMLTEIEAREIARKAAEELLRESEQRYALAAKGSNDGLWDWKLATDEIYFSPRWKQMLGYGDSEIGPVVSEWFSRIHPADTDRVHAEIEAHRSGATSEFASEYRMRHKNGSYSWMLSRGAVVRDENGDAIRMAGSQTDITEGKIADPLTGLPNRLYFMDRLEDAVQKEAPFAVFFVDLDRFKLVNDSLGHSAGDELLMGIAGRLKASVRGSSTRIGHSVVARLGGDEFAILLNGVDDMADAEAVADRILTSLASPFLISGRQVFGTVSIGIAAGSSADNPEDLLRNADTAMYHAKARGKARREVFDESMRDRAKARLEIETDLRKAIELNQMVLFYQPQVSLTDGRVMGYEALVRWQHPERGLVPPSEFIPVAEETGYIVPLGMWVLREACRQMALWHREFRQSDLTISVNVSFRQLNDANLVAEVRRALSETGLPATCLKLEMTESSIMANTDNAILVLDQLKAMGIGLEIDDFGTGYSSLSYLNRLPFDTVKIDRSFVRELSKTGESAELVRTILDMARSMNMHVVAEGVETPDQLDALTSLGCDCAQGYLFSRPVDKDATQSLMREQQRMRAAFGRLESREADESAEETEARKDHPRENQPAELVS